MIYVSSPKQPLQQPVMRSKNIEMEYLKYSTLPNVQKKQQASGRSVSSRVDDRTRTTSLPRNAGSVSMRKSTAVELREKAAIAAKQAAAASNQNEILKNSNISDGYLEDVCIIAFKKKQPIFPLSISSTGPGTFENRNSRSLQHNVRKSGETFAIPPSASTPRSTRQSSR